MCVCVCQTRFCRLECVFLVCVHVSYGWMSVFCVQTVGHFSTCFFNYNFSYSSRLFVRSLQLLFFFTLGQFPNCFAVGHPASGSLALSRSVLESSHRFHFIAQKENKTMGSPRLTQIHTHLIWKYHEKGILQEGKRKKQQRINNTIQELSSAPILDVHAATGSVRPRGGKRIAVGALFCTNRPSDTRYIRIYDSTEAPRRRDRGKRGTNKGIEWFHT